MAILQVLLIQLMLMVPKVHLSILAILLATCKVKLLHNLHKENSCESECYNIFFILMPVRVFLFTSSQLQAHNIDKQTKYNVHNYHNGPRFYMFIQIIISIISCSQSIFGHYQ